jgi:hypothetical protein
MTPAEVHRAWAPEGGAWSPWVKPVLFARLTAPVARVPLPPAPGWFEREIVIPVEAGTSPAAGPYRARRPLHDTALVIDLPSRTGTDLGVAVTAFGFRPIPLYNALPSPVAIVDVQPIMHALASGAEHVAPVPATAPPAFLLDAARRGERATPRPGLFDNRSICRASDFPSAERLRQAGIRRIVLVAESIVDDLEPALLEWQRLGLELWTKRPSERRNATPTVVRAAWLGRRLYRLWARARLRPGPDGIYGAMIEEPAVG